MRKHLLFFLTLALGPSSASAQLVSFGALGGITLTDQTTSRPDESRRYLVGPSVEFALPFRFAVEVDALYQRLGTSISYFQIPPGAAVLSQNPPTSGTTAFDLRERGNAWQFPVLGKYYFRPRSAPWRPFLGTGLVTRTVGDQFTGSAVINSGSGAVQTTSLNNNTRSTSVGVIVAAGVKIHAGPLAVLPQFRYTYRPSFDNLTPHNEAAFLLGVTF